MGQDVNIGGASQEPPGPKPDRALEALRDPLTRYFSRRVRNAAEVDDLVQDVFLRITVRGDVGSVRDLGGYVFQTAASVIADRQRRRVVRHAGQHDSFDAELHAGTDFDPDRVLAAKQSLRSATEVLMALPEKTRAIFVLRRLENLPYAQIAVRMGISISAVEKHMERATRRLMDRLEETS